MSKKTNKVDKKEDNIINEEVEVEAGEDKNEDDLQDNLLRALAEMENIRRRSVKDIENAEKRGKNKVTGKLAVILGQVEMAKNSLPKNLVDDAWASGVVSVFGDFTKLADSLGISRIDTAGMDFDSSLHEAIAQGEGDAGKIVAEVEAGWLLDGEVLRAAKVIVGKNQ